jgi:tryptophanyl-tRNA synthetase
VRILSGVQSSGRLHLGNYYGAIRQWVELQHQGDAFYFVANLHALNAIRDAELSATLTRDTAIELLAFGVDPTKATLFRQSDVLEVCELYWILGTLIPVANLERAHSYKDKIARGIQPDFGLFAYPVLMAADILLYGADRVPVGKDQLQHLEFARDWATKFNATYVRGYDPADPLGLKNGKPGILKLPEAFMRETSAVVPGLDGQKMSKSYGNTIDLFAPDKDVKKRIMGITTDSTPIEAPKPTDAVLYRLLQLMLPADEFGAADASWRAGGKGYGEYKMKLLDAFHATFDEPRRRRRELLADPGELERILQRGAQKAREAAHPYLSAVRKAVGL